MNSMNLKKNDEPDERQGGRPHSSKEITFTTDAPFAIRSLQIKRDDSPLSASGKRQKAPANNRSGHYTRSRIPVSPETTDIAFDATLRAAAPHQIKRAKEGVSLAISTADIREKVREKKFGTTIVFVVDSSGSMGAENRMSATKGAILSLLLDAYQKRDRIAMVAFKGNEACVILPPTDSIDLGKKSLETLPTGGKTPLSAGLQAALKLIKQEKRKGSKNNSLMIIISDGRANVSCGGGNAFNEALSICDEIRSVGIQSIVIDTESGFIKLGKMRELANKLDGKYFPMEQLQADQISGIINELV